MQGISLPAAVSWVILIALVLLVCLSGYLLYRNHHLKDTQNKFRTLVEQALIGIYLIQDGRFRYVNPRLAEIFGYSEEEFLRDLTVPDLVAEDDRELVMENLRRRQTGEIEEAHYAFRGRHKDGTIIHVEVHGHRTHYQGQPAVLGALLDRTAWADAEAGVHIRDRALSAIAEGVVITDANQDDFPIIYSNKAFNDITGYPLDEIQGLNCRFLQGNDRDQPELVKIKNAIQAGEECHATVRNYRRNGEMFYNELNLAPVRDEAGAVTHYVGIQRDISERKHVEQQLTLQSAALEAAANPIFIIELENRTIQWANRACCMLYEYDKEEVIGAKPTIFDSGHHTMSHWRHLMDALDTDHHWSGTTVNSNRYGRSITVSEEVTPILGESGQVSHLVIVHDDITAQLETNNRLHWLATHDSLTGLTNRATFKEVLEHEIARLDRNHQLLAVHFIDLDGFKEINDSLGHQAGDELLKMVADLLQECARKSDLVSRFGGDEFAVLQLDTKDNEHVRLFTDRLLSVLNQRLQFGGNVTRCRASIGVALHPLDETTTNDAEALLDAADIALYEAKRHTPGGYVVYSRELGSRERDRIKLIDELEDALRGNQFFIAYQPQIDLATNRISGLEALVRWQHPERGIISPAHFIPIAEESGIILPLSRWIMNEVCHQAYQWQQAGLLQDRRIAINLSALQFRDPGFPDEVFEMLKRTGLSPQVLDLEITETALMESRHVYSTMDALHAESVSFSVDDFGTGYSSMLYLKRMPIRQLKIDKEFTISCVKNSNDAEIVRAVINLAHNLELTAIAEGVETAEHASTIREMGCDYAQGYYYSRPVDGVACERLLRDGLGTVGNAN